MSWVIYRGPSLINGEEVFAVLSNVKTESANTKTGDMAQLSFYFQDIPPHESQKTGQDEAVCGDCPLRPLIFKERKAAGTVEDGERPCYVLLWRGELSKWKGAREKAVDLDGATKALKASGKPLRCGTFGDIASMPLDIFSTLTGIGA